MGTKELSSALPGARGARAAGGHRTPAPAAGDAAAGTRFPAASAGRSAFFFSPPPHSAPRPGHPPFPRRERRGLAEGARAGRGVSGVVGSPLHPRVAAAAAGWQHVPAEGHAEGLPPSSSSLPTAGQAGRSGRMN